MSTALPSTAATPNRRRSDRRTDAYESNTAQALLYRHPLNHSEITFRLDPAFVASYADLTPPFGFNGLGLLVYMRTYSRLKSDGSNERWHETVERVVNGCYSMQKRWVLAQGMPWNEAKAQRSAEEMYDRMYHMKFLPPGRGLWAMGSALTEERGLYAALLNCAFCSTKNIDKTGSEPFTFLMDASMLGIGVGFDVRGAGLLTIHKPLGGPDTYVSRDIDADGHVQRLTFIASMNIGEDVEPKAYTIPDTREGWVNSLRLLIDSYFEPGLPHVEFNYDKIRAAGEPIRGFGGVASGPDPLRQLHEDVRSVLDKEVGKPLSQRAIVDIMNMIGACVVAGNVRRTAEIAFGDMSDEYLDLKNYAVNPEREAYGWTSNNSVFAPIGCDYREAAKRVAINGEPGFMWLDNMRGFGRMGDGPNASDAKVDGSNPCGEQPLEDMECCNLVETFPARHDSLDDYRRTLKFAYLFAKTVTLAPTPWARTNAIMMRNRRIGLSQSGIVQAIAKIGTAEYRQWCDLGYATVRAYDAIYSDWLCVPRSIRVTSVKPSGTVSLLAGATPGKHYPEARFYIRRMRLSIHSPLIIPLVDAGYKVEPCVGSEATTVVVEIPVAIDEDVRTVNQVSMWEQLALAAFLQKHWADNQVSATITFNPETEGLQIAPALDLYQFQLKGISFLPRPDLFPKPGTESVAPYAQMPYETITEAVYHASVAKLLPLTVGRTSEDSESERFCDSSKCVI